MEEVIARIVALAKTDILYMSNLANGDEQLNNKLKNDTIYGISIVRKWRKLGTDDSEFTSGMWDYDISRFVLDRYYALGDENKHSSSHDGGSASYAMSPEAALKSRIPQVIA